MEFLLKSLNEAMEIPMSTLVLISVMSSIAMYFVRSHLVIPGLVIFLYPVVVVLSAIANFCLTKLEVFPLNKYDQWLICTISSSTIGIVLTLGLAALLARFSENMQANRKVIRQS